MHTCFHASTVPSPFDAAFVLAWAVLHGLRHQVLECCTATACRRIDDNYLACIEHMALHEAVFCCGTTVIHCYPLYSNLRLSCLMPVEVHCLAYHSEYCPPSSWRQYWDCADSIWSSVYVMSSSVLLPVHICPVLHPPLNHHLRCDCNPKSANGLG
jgi:hypothetical protein